MGYDVIIDCYTDEPSGLGVPPFLSVHSRYIVGCLEQSNTEYYYLTIDDLRYANNERHFENSFNKRILNTTKNKENIKEIIKNAKNIYVVMGCFVKYEYVSAEPPTFNEVEELLNKYSNEKTNKLLFYSLGGSELTRKSIRETVPPKLFNEIIFGNTYNYFLGETIQKFRPNYDKLKENQVKVEKIDNRIIATSLNEGNSFEIPEDAMVSMNLSLFTPSFFIHLENKFHDFLEKNKDNPDNCEFFMPDAIFSAIREEYAIVRGYQTTATWYGITYKEDKEIVLNALKKLTEDGTYPKSLWT